MTYLIAGLGNPTKKYEGTRHNVGFETIDILSADCGIEVREKKHKALCGKGMINGSRVILAKPQTYMNLSGESLRLIADFYQIPPENIIVICDDINLPCGQLRIRARGSAGGHNGLKNIILHLGSQDFMRVRIGVGEKPEGWELADYVLSRTGGEDRKILNDAEKDAAEAVKLMAAGEITKAMNLYKKFKGGEPTVDALLIRDGIKQ